MSYLNKIKGLLNRSVSVMIFIYLYFYLFIYLYKPEIRDVNILSILDFEKI